MIPWIEKDYEKWHQAKWCAVCGRRIAVDADFWSFDKIYWHADCVPIKQDMPKSDWRDTNA